MSLSPAQKRTHQAALRLFAETGSSDVNVSELAARGLGLDRGPMYGFDNAKVDAEFFGCGKELHSDEREFFTAGHLRSNFLCKLGYGDRSKLYRRQPRLDFDEACQLV